MAEQICERHKERLDPELGECPLCVAEAGEDPRRPDPQPAEEGEIEVEEGMDGEGEGGASDADETIVPLARRFEEAGGERKAEADAETGDEKDKAKADAIAAFSAKLKDVKDRGQFAILFFGFKTAGKTWLLHRMKEQLYKQDSIHCEPRFEEVRVPEGDRKGLPGTTQIEFHTVLARPSFVLIDIPGEYTEFLLEWNFTELQMMLAAIDYAKAMIIAMPADVLIFGEYFPGDDKSVIERAGIEGLGRVRKAQQKSLLHEWAKEFRLDNDHFGKFAEGMQHLAGLVSFVRREGIDYTDPAKFKARVTRDAVINHMQNDDFVPVGGEDGLDCPVFIALTKSDLVLSLFFNSTDATWKAMDRDIAERAESRVFASLPDRGLPAKEIRSRLRDPWAMVRLVRPDLHRELMTAFPLAKFDYVTAFYGHDGLPSLTRGHYKKHPQRGVIEILEWVRDAARLSSRPRFVRRPYAWAVRARLYVEGIRRSRRFDFPSGPRR